MELLGKLSKVCYRVASVIAVSVLSFLTLLLFASVIMRYFFNSPIVWQYEITLLCMSWVFFIGMSMTFRMEEHMSLTFVVNAIKPKSRVVWINIIDIVLIAFLVVSIFSGIEVASKTWGTTYMTIEVSKGLFYLAYPIGAVFSLIHLVYLLLTRDVDSLPSILEAAHDAPKHHKRRGV